MGRNKYSQHEIDIIGMLLKKKCTSTRFQQKMIRHQLRVNFEFNISDFGTQGKAFGYEELQECIRRGVIKVLDDETIANMKAKRLRDKERDARIAEQQAIDSGEAVDWKQVLKEWDEWEEQKEQ